jgi:cytochrome P450
MVRSSVKRKEPVSVTFFNQAVEARDPETGAKFTTRQLIMEALLLVVAGE